MWFGCAEIPRNSLDTSDIEHCQTLTALTNRHSSLKKKKYENRQGHWNDYILLYKSCLL